MELSFTYNLGSWFISCLILFGLIVYLLFLKGKDLNTYLLLCYFLIMLLSLFLPFAYLHFEYAPRTAHVFIILNGVIFAMTLFALFLYRYPENSHPLETKIVVSAFLLADLVLYPLYVSALLENPIVYHFDTHMWKFLGGEASAETMGLAMMFQTLWIIALSLRKSVGFSARETGLPARDRVLRFLWRPVGRRARMMRVFAFGTFFTVFSAIAFALTSQGILTWEQYMFIFPTSATLAAISYAFLYLDNSPLPTTFRVKIVGFSLVTTLLIVGLSARMIFTRLDQEYEKRKQVELDHIRAALLRDIEPHFSAKVAYLAVVGPGGYRIIAAGRDSLRAGELAASDGIMENNLLTIRSVRLRRPLTKVERAGMLKAYRAPEGGRRYRYLDPVNKATFYMYYNIAAGDRVYQVGYPYAEYRRLMHVNTRAALWTLLFAALFVLLVFPVLFQRSLVEPLESLLRAVRGMREGDKQVFAPIFVEDEIGTLTRSFNAMAATIHDYVEHLEDKVQLRTRKLQRSLNVIRELKERQDGDYFLMSLLVDPLSRVGAGRGTFHNNIFLKNYKSFRFRNRARRIGGDFCTVERIHLREKPFLFFMNADAMGKSSQGASGILVLGSVLRAVLSRTAAGEPGRYAPEIWLRELLVELNRVFNGFDGYMMISMIAGLADEETGFVYYFNAEHPYPVLMRQGRADFLETRITYSKIGFAASIAEYRIATFQLREGDLLIFGSDGKDDIQFDSRSEDGEKRFNDDETLFLRLVEETDGDLEQLYASVRSRGKIIDDFSLLSLACERIPGVSLDGVRHDKLNQQLASLRNEFAQEAEPEEREDLEDLRSNPAQPRRLRRMINRLSRRRDLPALAGFCEWYLQVDPGHEKVLFLFAQTCRRLGRLDRARELTARLRLRSPDSPAYRALEERLRHSPFPEPVAGRPRRNLVK